MAKIRRCQIPLYRMTFEYCSNKDVLVKKYELDETSNYGGFCYVPQPDTIVMYLPHENGSVVIPDLAHEAFHAAMFVSDYVGLAPTLQDNESAAYLISWFCEKVLDFANSESANR